MIIKRGMDRSEIRIPDSYFDVEINVKRNHKMDIYSFVNSKVIRNHLKSINYEFDSLETAWLIFQCKSLSYEQKRKAWFELIATMPDCEVPERNNCLGWKSLHDMIKQYIYAYDSLVSDFVKNDEAGTSVYSYEYFYDGDKDWTEAFDDLYTSFEECVKAYKSDVADLDEGRFGKGDTGVRRYRIRKIFVGNPGRYMLCQYTKDDEFYGIDCYWPIEEQAAVLEYSFEGLWFDFPTPFKKGDIVWVPNEDNERPGYWFDQPFILKGLSTWDLIEHIVKNGDNSDMNGYGTYVNASGTVYHEVMANYMDLEYYPTFRMPNEGVMHVISEYMKEKLCFEDLLNEYRREVFEIAANART